MVERERYQYSGPLERKTYTLPAGYQLSERQLPQGKTNATLVVKNHLGKEFVWKTDRYFEGGYRRTQTELARIGYLNRGGKFGIRSYRAEATFSQSLATAKLQALSAVSADDQGIMFPYVESHDLQLLLRAGRTAPIKEIIEDVIRAHVQGIRYGDRWPQNILVLPNGSFQHIDFDLQITGQASQELELAQLLFGMTRDAHDKITLLNDLGTSNLFEHLSRYDWKVCRKFITAYARGFTHQSPLEVRRLTEAVADLTSL